MQNVELKARITQPEKLIILAKEIGAQFTWQRSQKDTYFDVSSGKLKLRHESDGKFAKAELIAYNRPEGDAEKISDYMLYETSDPEKFIATLSHVMPVRIVVPKIRTLYMWKNVRIHFDKVDGLGDFLEFEAVVSDQCNTQECFNRVHFLKEKLQVKDGQLISCGYYDLMVTA